MATSHANRECGFKTDDMETPTMVFVLQMEGRKWLKGAPIGLWRGSCMTYFPVRYQTPPPSWFPPMGWCCSTCNMRFHRHWPKRHHQSTIHSKPSPQFHSLWFPLPTVAGNSEPPPNTFALHFRRHVIDLHQEEQYVEIQFDFGFGFKFWYGLVCFNGELVFILTLC